MHSSPVTYLTPRQSESCSKKRTTNLAIASLESLLHLSRKMPTTGPSYWILTGDRGNWRRGISDRIWGVVPALQSAWEALQRGDFLFFYAKAPASSIFGTGIVRDKFRQDRPLWVDEIQAGKVLYPHRFTFDMVSFIDEDRWATEGVPPEPGVPYRAGMNRIPLAISSFDALWGLTMSLSTSFLLRMRWAWLTRQEKKPKELLALIPPRYGRPAGHVLKQAKAEYAKLP